MIFECPNLQSDCAELLNNPEANSQSGAQVQGTMWVFYGDPQWQDPLLVHRLGYTPMPLASLMKSCGLYQVKQESSQFKLRETRGTRVTGIKTNVTNTPKKSMSKINFICKLSLNG